MTNGQSVTGACSGTVISIKGGNGVVLTAAHCAVKIDGSGQMACAPATPPSNLLVLQGNDYSAPKAT